VGRVLLVPFGRIDAGFLRDLGRGLGRVLPFEMALTRARLEPVDAFDRDRGQFHSTHILELLLEAHPAGADERLLGVVDRDLFIPILTFVFGEAQLAGPAAVFSLTRLDPRFYGLPEDPEVLLERSVKEALHELGHTFGLYHCRRPDCVMRASTSAEDVDLKPPRFCRTCSRSVKLPEK
jgi:archaemetzincin